MRAIGIAAVLGLLMTASAQAYCVNLPANGTDSGVTANRTVCLQQELSDKVNLQSEIQAQTDAALSRIQTDMMLERMQQNLRDAQQDFRNP